MPQNKELFHESIQAYFDLLVHNSFAPVWTAHAGNQFEQGAFAAAVCAADGEQVVRKNIQVEPTQYVGCCIRVTIIDMFQGEQRRAAVFLFPVTGYLMWGWPAARALRSRKTPSQPMMGAKKAK